MYNNIKSVLQCAVKILKYIKQKTYINWPFTCMNTLKSQWLCIYLQYFVNSDGSNPLVHISLFIEQNCFHVALHKTSQFWYTPKLQAFASNRHGSVRVLYIIMHVSCCTLGFTRICKLRTLNYRIFLTHFFLEFMISTVLNLLINASVKPKCTVKVEK